MHVPGGSGQFEVNTSRFRVSRQCFLACHKRCLESLAIQCGHKKLQGRLQLFGREFTQVASCANDGIPFILTKCISEIERRALKMKVYIYEGYLKRAHGVPETL